MTFLLTSLCVCMHVCVCILLLQINIFNFSFIWSSKSKESTYNLLENIKQWKKKCNMFALQYVSCWQLFLGMYCRNEKKLFISYALKTKVKVKSLSRVGLFATPWTVAHQAPPSMGFSRQQYWSGLPFPSPGNLPNPGIEPRVSRIAGRCFTLWATREVLCSFAQQ